jgi:predicted dehydrogenase
VAIVEKPIAIQGEDWRDVRNLFASASTAFVVNTQLRFHDRVGELHRNVTDGRIGEVRLIDTSARSTLLDQGVHLLDLAHWFASDVHAADVFAQVSGTEAMSLPEPSPDLASATIRFQSGLRATLLTGLIAPSIEPNAPFYLHKRIAVYGTRGFVHWSMSGWERHTEDGGYESGTHPYEAEDDRAQATLTDSAFALAEGGDPALHPTKLERSVEQFGVLLAAYVSSLRHAPVALPHEPPDGLLAELDHALGGSSVRAGPSVP